VALELILSDFVTHAHTLAQRRGSKTLTYDLLVEAARADRFSFLSDVLPMWAGGAEPLLSMAGRVPGGTQQTLGRR
jgi:hypothetical protein